MAEKNIVPNLEAKASDGNPKFTPRQWLERFRQFTKREHKIDITPLVKGEPENPGRVQNETGQYKNQRPNPVIYRTLPPKTKHISQ